VSLAPEASLHDYRVLAAALADHAKEAPLVVLRQAHAPTGEAALIDASVKLGGLLCDGLGDVVSIRPGSGPDATAIAVDLAYRILQGARQRTTRTEYISCPSCGRTLFDLEETTARIKSRTDHLSGVKIAVMGCIVNGPGESKHADIGISLPGTGETPAAPVFIDGKKAVTLRGARIADEFKGLVIDYIERRYGGKADAAE
jgi:(E)-4-hydroxy-3-methylbut-2-enyl-diphosphate synthase